MQTMRIATVIAVISVCCVFCFVAVRFAIADYYQNAAQKAFQSVDLGASRYGQELTESLRLVNKALAWRHNYAEALDLKGDILYQRWWISPDAQFLSQSKTLQHAVSLHKAALTLRQGWSFAVARLALIYSHQRSLDEDAQGYFEFWFNEAHRLGLYETGIALSLMQLGFEKWSELNQSLRIKTLDFTQVSIEQKSNSAQKIRTILDKYQRLAFVCNALAQRSALTLRAQAVCS